MLFKSVIIWLLVKLKCIMPDCKICKYVMHYIPYYEYLSVVMHYIHASGMIAEFAFSQSIGFTVITLYFIFTYLFIETRRSACLRNECKSKSDVCDLMGV